MRIVEYDEADPAGVFALNLLSLEWSLTPERVALIRRLDPRPFPFFALYAVEDDCVAGQVGVYRQPMLTIEGPEDVGGACAVCTHPSFNRRGIAARLLEETHARMRAAGLRFSTLGTARHRAAYSVYRRQGYEDLFATTSTFARLESVAREASLRAERAGTERLALADAFFPLAAAGGLGFARRHAGFIAMMAAIGDVQPDDVWLIWDGREMVGYAMAKMVESALTVGDLLLLQGVDAAQAVAALVQALQPAYVRVRIHRPSVAASLRRAGYPAERPDWSTFMVKPLAPDVTTDDARRLFAVGTERFLISSIDVT